MVFEPIIIDLADEDEYVNLMRTAQVPGKPALVTCCYVKW